MAKRYMQICTSRRTYHLTSKDINQNECSFLEAKSLRMNKTLEKNLK